ncbi:MAG: enoyl-CoA hydratase/isomerase family protein [Actinomycetota bacterium]
MALVEVGSVGSTITILLNRPEARNALSLELCDAIVEALEQAERSESARVIVIAGAGPVFSSGADFAAVSGPEGVDFLPAFGRMLSAVAGHRLPTIARVQGAALGGGLQLATVCDFRVCAADARLGIPSSRLGVVVNLENVERLVDLIGIARAKEVLMTGKVFTGNDALAAGLVTESCEPDELERATERWALGIAALAPLSVQGAKHAIQLIVAQRALRAHKPEAALEVDALVAEAYASDDLTEGIRAMGEKRPPDFRGS